MSAPLRKFQQGWSRLLSAGADPATPVASGGPAEQRLLDGVMRLPQIETVVEGYRAALRHLDGLESAALATFGDELPQPVSKAHLLFAHRNALSDFARAFFRACDANEAVAAGLRRYCDDPALPDACLLAFSDQQYRLLYTAFAFGQVRGEAHPDLDQVFRRKGLDYLGKIACAANGPTAETGAQSPDRVWLEIRKRSPLAELRAAADSDNKASLATDVIHYLAIVAAAAAAGALDPGDEKDRALLVAATAVVDDLVDELG